MKPVRGLLQSRGVGEGVPAATGFETTSGVLQPLSGIPQGRGEQAGNGSDLEKQGRSYLKKKKKKQEPLRCADPGG